MINEVSNRKLFVTLNSENIGTCYGDVWIKSSIEFGMFGSVYSFLIFARPI